VFIIVSIYFAVTQSGNFWLHARIVEVWDVCECEMESMRKDVATAFFMVACYPSFWFES